MTHSPCPYEETIPLVVCITSRLLQVGSSDPCPFVLPLEDNRLNIALRIYVISIILSCRRTSEVKFTKTQEVELNHVDEKPTESDVLIKNSIKKKEPSLLKVLLKTFGPFFLIGSVFKLFQDLLSFVNPQLLR